MSPAGWGCVRLAERQWRVGREGDRLVSIGGLGLAHLSRALEPTYTMPTTVKVSQGSVVRKAVATPKTSSVGTTM